MHLRITNLKALAERFQVKNPRWRPKTRVSMVRNAIISDEKKHQDDENRRKSFSNQRKRIYLVNNIFEAWEMQRSRPDVNVVVRVISPRSVVSEYRIR